MNERAGGESTARRIWRRRERRRANMYERTAEKCFVAVEPHKYHVRAAHLRHQHVPCTRGAFLLLRRSLRRLRILFRLRPHPLLFCALAGILARGLVARIRRRRCRRTAHDAGRVNHLVFQPRRFGSGGNRVNDALHGALWLTRTGRFGNSVGRVLTIHRGKKKKNERPRETRQSNLVSRCGGLACLMTKQTSVKEACNNFTHGFSFRAKSLATISHPRVLDTPSGCESN